MALSLEEVRKVAKLARLALSAEEEEKMRVQLSNILHEVERLQALDLSDVPPTLQATDLSSVFRPDVARPSLPREEILSNAPDKVDGFFRVKGIFE